MIGNCIRCGKDISDIYLVCTECAKAKFEDNIFWIAAGSVIGNPVTDRYREDSVPTLTIGERPGEELEYMPGEPTLDEVKALLGDDDPERILHKMNTIMAELGVSKTIDFKNYLFSPKDVLVFSEIFSSFEGMEFPTDGLPELENVYLRLANLFYYDSECADISAFEPKFRTTIVDDLLAQAEKYYKEAITRSQDSTAARNLGWLYLGIEDHSGAEEHFRIALELDENDIDAQIGLAEVLFETGKHDEADEIIDRLITVDRNDPRIWYLKARSTQADGRWGGAVQLYDQAFNKDRNFIDALIMKGRVLIDEGMYEEANRVFDQIIEKDDFNADAWYWKAKVLYITEKWGGALQCIHEALSIDTQMVQGWGLKGDILYEREVYEEAMVAYDNALEIAPDSEEIRKKKETCEKNMG